MNCNNSISLFCKERQAFQVKRLVENGFKNFRDFSDLEMTVNLNR
jgi:hypothetical protein